MAAIDAPFRAVGPAAMAAGGKCAWRMPPHVVAAGLCMRPRAEATSHGTNFVVALILMLQKRQLILLQIGLH
jgi:hypothetical protein